jgi:competence protein ComEC
VGPALRSLGINKVDWAVVTHPHADHLGGMFWILNQFDVGALLHSGTLEKPPLWLGLLKLAQERQVPVINLNEEPAPAAWEHRVAKLAPEAPRLSGTKNDMHNNNVVLKVGDWLLLMGDMQKEGEERLVHESAPLRCDVLKVGHHGSRTSSSPAFLKAADPKACVIQCGAHNFYRHPSPLTLNHLAGRQLFRNDLQGCIFLEHDASGTRLWSWRQADPAALWEAPPKRRRSIWKSLEKRNLLDSDAEEGH